MNALDPAYLMLVLEQQEKASQALLPAFRAHVEAKQRQLVQVDAPGAARGSPAVAAAQQATGISDARLVQPAGSLGVQAMLAQAQALVGNKAAKSSPELAGDPQLFKTALTRAGEEWDSIKATENGKMDIFMRQLPAYSMDATRGCNTVVLRAQMTSLASSGFERQFAAINVGRAGSQAGAAAALSRDLLTHVYWRVDPSKLSAESSYRYRFGQTYKQGGRWSADVKRERAFTGVQWPFRTDRPFFVRIILDPRGALSYVDGKFFSYTPYPGGRGPEDGEALYLQVPLAGDAGEKPTWRVLSAHWGSCRTDMDAERAMAEFFNSPAGQAAIASMRVESDEEVYVTGLPPGATDGQVVEALRAFGAVQAVRDRERAGAATVRLVLSGGRSIAEVVALTDRKVTIAGAVVNVTRALHAFRPGAAGPPPPAQGGLMHVGLAPYGSGSQVQAGMSPASVGGTSSQGGGGASSGVAPGGQSAYNPTSPEYG